MQPVNWGKIKNIIQLLKPNRESLLKLISSRLTTEMLVDIASADYGYKAEENLAALRKIITDYQMPTRYILDYEVLGLIRHLKPMEDDIESTVITSIHLKRAFCCTILITANTFEDNDYYDMSLEYEEYNIIQLIESVNYLGKDFQLATIFFLAWKMNKEGLFYEDELNNPISLLTLIYLLLKAKDLISEDNLKVLTELLLTVKENEYRTWWIFDAALSNQSKWIKLGEDLLQISLGIKNEDLRKNIQNLCDLILLNQ